RSVVPWSAAVPPQVDTYGVRMNDAGAMTVDLNTIAGPDVVKADVYAPDGNTIVATINSGTPQTMAVGNGVYTIAVARPWDGAPRVFDGAVDYQIRATVSG